MRGSAPGKRWCCAIAGVLLMTAALPAIAETVLRDDAYRGYWRSNGAYCPNLAFAGVGFEPGTCRGYFAFDLSGVPMSVSEAVALLAADTEARCLAGGATLVALMNARLVEPSRLVSLAAVEELAGFDRAPDGTVRIGAMRRHRETAFECDLRDGQRVVGEAAAHIANPTVRNMGTIGGAVCFADPAADYPPALIAADATIELAGPDGPRTVPAADFFTDWYETALAPGEIVTAVTLPPAPQGSVGLYHKLARVSGDFAIASVAVTLRLQDGRCDHIRLAVGGCGPTPIRLAEVDDMLLGTDLADDTVGDAGRCLAQACDPVDDVRASADYRRLVVPRLVRRALAEAKTLALGVGA